MIRNEDPRYRGELRRVVRELAASWPNGITARQIAESCDLDVRGVGSKLRSLEAWSMAEHRSLVKGEPAVWFADAAVVNCWRLLEPTS